MTSSLIEALNDVRDKRGLLTPEVVVEEATSPDHPLHTHFEWDDSIAGHKFRLQQAGNLLRVTEKPTPDAEFDLRAFVVVSGQKTARSEYVPRDEALGDPFMRELLLQRMRRDAQSFMTRYQHMAEYAEMLSNMLAGAK